MKTATINLNYDSTNVNKVEIENNMAPLTISTSTSGQIEVQAELSIHSFSPGTDIAEYFDVHEENNKLIIVLEEIPELSDSRMRFDKSQVMIRIPQMMSVSAEGENLPISAEGLDGDLSLHNENGPLYVNNCNGSKELENENGPIKIQKCTGNIHVTLENGPLSAEKLNGTTLVVESENGPIKVRSASFTEVKITNENGVIYYEAMPGDEGDYSFENENGVVHLVLPEDFDFELEAETESGTITSTISAEISSDGNVKRIKRGEGKNKIHVVTENGVIKINSDGQVDLSFLKMKLHDLKVSISNSHSTEDKEKAIAAMEKVITALEKAVDKVSEVRIKDKINEAIVRLRESVEKFNVEEAKDKVVETVDNIGDEIVDSLKDILRKVKDHHEEHLGHGQPPFTGEINNLKEYIHKVINSSFVKPYIDKGLNTREKQEVDERSRIKILEMLEAGKITAEEAEKLLKAISKE
jgi:hypothetical protein